MTTQTFVYEAVDHQGLLQRGSYESDSVEKVVQHLSAQRLIPINVNTQGAGLRRELRLPGFRNRTGVMDLAVLSRQFASMTSSGLSLIRSLGILEDQTVKPGLKKAVRSVRLDIQRGSSLSDALAQHVEHFPPLMIDMVRAGETGGFLDEALDRIATMYEADANLRASIKTALTYPVIVLIFSMLMGGGVVLFIVPIFERMFTRLGGQLPLPTRILVALSHNLVWIAPLMIVTLVVVERAVRHRIRHNQGFEVKVDRLRMRLPVFGNLFTKLAISRWARNLATLVSVGVPLMQSLDIVGGASGSGVITLAMQDVQNSVRQGQRVSTALARHQIFPAMVVQMVEVGEETGQLVQMLDKVSEYYDREVKTATESLTAALEPLMVVFMGLVIGAMVICLYLPMFTIYQHIQGGH
jgi:type IV pilus assembly protein PilC